MGMDPEMIDVIIIDDQLQDSLKNNFASCEDYMQKWMKVKSIILFYKSFMHFFFIN